MQSEESLVSRVRRRDSAAFTELYEANFNKIYRYIALRIGDRMEAEDLTQQVFLNAFKSAPSFEWRGTPVAAWLFRIAHNQVIDHLRKKRREMHIPLDDAPPTASGDDPEKTAELSFDIDKLNLATRKLTGLQTEVISLRFAGGLSTREVAKIMGRSEGAIKALQHSAVEALRRALAVTSNEKRPSERKTG